MLIFNFSTHFTYCFVPLDESLSIAFVYEGYANFVLQNAEFRFYWERNESESVAPLSSDKSLPFSFRFKLFVW